MSLARCTAIEFNHKKTLEGGLRSGRHAVFASRGTVGVAGGASPLTHAQPRHCGCFAARKVCILPAPRSAPFEGSCHAQGPLLRGQGSLVLKSLPCGRFWSMENIGVWTELAYRRFFRAQKSSYQTCLPYARVFCGNGSPVWNIVSYENISVWRTLLHLRF